MQKIDPLAVARRLQRLREYHSMSKTDFAATVGIDKSSYTKLEAGTKPLTAQMAYDIAERWGVTMDYLYRGRLTDVPHALASTHKKSRIPGS